MTPQINYMMMGGSIFFSGRVALWKHNTDDGAADLFLKSPEWSWPVRPDLEAPSTE